MANVLSIGRLMGIKKIIDVNPVTVVEDSDIQINLWLPLDTSAKRGVERNLMIGSPRRWTE